MNMRSFFGNVSFSLVNQEFIVFFREKQEMRSSQQLWEKSQARVLNRLLAHKWKTEMAILYSRQSGFMFEPQKRGDV